MFYQYPALYVCAMKSGIIAALSIVICVLVGFTSLTGVMNPDFYQKETLNWQAQSFGQDVINLCLVIPVLLSTSLLVLANRHYAKLLWAGALLYLIYTYVIYCFNVHFNVFFIEYCIILSLCFYLILYFFYTQASSPTPVIGSFPLINIIGKYFIVLSLLFYFLWLSEIIPAVRTNAVPKTIVEVGLFTNPVHVIDLAVLLPGVFITGILLLKQKKLGYILAPVLLTFFVLMDCTIAALTFIMNKRGIEANRSVIAIMAVFAVFSVVLLVLSKRKLKLV